MLYRSQFEHGHIAPVICAGPGQRLCRLILRQFRDEGADFVACLIAFAHRVAQGARDHVDPGFQFLSQKEVLVIVNSSEETYGKSQPALDAIGTDRALDLRGRAAIANARLAYGRFKERFGGADFEQQRRRGARVQRPLWASTSTKNPDYRDVLYVESLIGPDTVNTLPPATLDAFQAHGEMHATLESDGGQAEKDLQALAELGIDLAQVTEELERDGIAKFADSYDALLALLDRDRFCAEMQQAFEQMQAIAGDRGRGQRLTEEQRDALLASGRRLFSLKAGKDTECMVMTREKFAKAIAQFPELVPRIFRSVVDSIRRWDQHLLFAMTEKGLSLEGMTGISAL